MRYIETIKIVDGTPCNLEAHINRIEQTIGKRHPLNLACELMGKVKCRVLYDELAVIEITYAKYTIPIIKSLTIVESPSINYSRKSEDRSSIAALFAMRGDADDIIITRHGAVTDTSFCNVVFENCDGFFTPDTHLLNGTKRQQLISMGTVHECHISIDDISKFDRIHLVNAMLELGDVVVESVVSNRVEL